MEKPLQDIPEKFRAIVAELRQDSNDSVDCTLADEVEAVMEAYGIETQWVRDHQFLLDDENAIESQILDAAQGG